MEEKETPLKNSFPFYWEMYDLARKHLSQEDKANLFDVVCEYGFFRRELAEKTPMVGMIWGMLKKTYDNVFRQYDRCKKNGKEGAKHGVKGGRPRKKKPQEKPQVIYEYNELFEYIQ